MMHKSLLVLSASQGLSVTTNRSSLSTFPNTEKRVKNTTSRGVFLTNFEVFGYVVIHCLECLIKLSSQSRLEPKRKWKNKIVKYMLIRFDVQYCHSCLNHRHPKLTIRGIDQIFMIYLRVSSET